MFIVTTVPVRSAGWVARRKHRCEQPPRTTLGERFIEIAALGRLHARGAARAAWALRDQTVGVLAELFKAQERGARQTHATGVTVVDEDRG